MDKNNNVFFFRLNYNINQTSVFCSAGDEYAAKFLIENKADMNMAMPNQREMPLHQAAQFSPHTCNKDVMTGMANMGRLMLQEGTQVNA